jgi:hypothetical protein
LICVLCGETHLIRYVFDKGCPKWGHSVFRTNEKTVPENSSRRIIAFLQNNFKRTIISTIRMIAGVDKSI